MAITRITYMQELPDGSTFVSVRETTADVAHKLDQAKAAGLATIHVTAARSNRALVIPVGLVGPFEERR